MSAATTTVHYTLDITETVANAATELVPQDYTLTKSVMRKLVSFSHTGARTTVTTAQSVATAVQEVAVAVVVPVLAHKGLEGLCRVGDNMISYATAVEPGVSKTE